MKKWIWDPPEGMYNPLYMVCIQRTKNQIDIGYVNGNSIFKMELLAKPEGKECGTELLHVAELIFKWKIKL